MSVLVLMAQRLTLILLTLLVCVFSSIAGAQTRLTGEIDGAQYIIDLPSEPTGDILLIARGYRPDFFPLSPIYEVETDFYQTLLKEGWTIGSTSYRTNKWVVAEGGADVLALRHYINREIVPAQRVIVYGETMGGGVAVWLAENAPEAFSGIFALGAYLYVEPTSDSEGSTELASIFNAKPQLPIMFVANGEEVASSDAYANGIETSVKYKPVVRLVKRDGHVNVNSAERLSAMRALLGWIEGDQVDSVSDATIKMSPGSSANIVDGAAAGKIRRIRPLYGNVYTSLVVADLQRLDIEIGDAFNLMHNESTYTVTFANAYSDVAYGAWVAFIDSEGYLQISRNYANAAETLNAEKGDPLILTKM